MAIEKVGHVAQSTLHLYEISLNCRRFSLLKKNIEIRFESFKKCLEMFSCHPITGKGPVINDVTTLEWRGVIYKLSSASINCKKKI